MSENIPVNDLLRISGQILDDAIGRAPGVRPSFVTRLDNFSWSAFSAELAQVVAAPLRTSEVQAQLGKSLQTSIHRLLTIFRNETKRLRAEILRRDKLIIIEEWQQRVAELQARHSAPLEKSTQPPTGIRRGWPSIGHRTSNAEVAAVERALRDALGELYGSGTMPKFVSPSGKMDWVAFGIAAMVPVRAAKEIAEHACESVLRELRDAVLNYRNMIEKSLMESRLDI